ncbi:GAF domain-containing protein [Jatrophihabitans sp.]|uniref:GAF domain-containing protein n=1 Tax=Jatrophihabitans sp. TaxID=1932789 RepID=UPI0030C70BAA|nr:histidine kinase [Jatrophihabitans sp.]
MTQPDDDLLAQLAASASHLAPALGLPDADAMLQSICRTARLVFRAAACSVAELQESEGALRYRIADGAGAGSIVGMRLPLDRGVASYVATSGQAIAVDQVRQDPRFAADVADATGYVPRAMLVVPIEARTGEVLGVLSVLDADRDAVPPEEILDIAAAFADQAALALQLGTVVARFGSVLLGAFADAAASGDVELSLALRRRARAAKGAEADAAALAARFGELRSLGPGVTYTAGRIVDEFLGYARASRGRRG